MQVGETAVLPRHSVPRSVAGDPRKARLNELNPRAFSLVAPLRLLVNHLRSPFIRSVVVAVGCVVTTYSLWAAMWECKTETRTKIM